MEADELLLLRKLESHLSGKYGVKNTKGGEVLDRACHIDTVLIASDEKTEIWKSISVEPICSGHGPIFKITCEIEEEHKSLGISRKQKTEELVFAGNGPLPSGSFTRLP
ncbi:MAG: hypothetical protein V1820_03835 [archaeon]